MEKRLTIRKLHEISGIATGTIVRGENAQSIPQDLTLQDWAKALDLDPTEMVALADEERKESPAEDQVERNAS